MNADAKEYLPMFGRRKVTKEQMDLMTHKELSAVSDEVPPFFLEISRDS